MKAGSRAGTLEIGAFFKRARAAAGDHGIYDFAEHVLRMDGSFLGRIEAGDRLPGPEVLAKIEPFLRLAGEDPLELLRLWLHAQGLSAFVAAIDQRADAVSGAKRRAKKT